MITAQQMSDVLKTYKLKLEFQVDGWHARTADGGRLHRGSRPTPEEAVEAAALTLSEAEVRRDAADSTKLMRALQRGRYNVVASRVTVPDPEAPGGTTQVAQFVSKRLNGQVISPSPRTTFIEAMQDAEVALGPG